MKRRDFLAAASLTGFASLGASVATLRADDSASSGKEFYELRRYLFDNSDQQKRLLDFVGSAGIRGLQRVGIQPIGVFTPLESEILDVWVVLPHKSVAALVTSMQQLAEDDEFLSAADEYINVPFDAPAFQRVESSLLLAFDGIPQLERPTKAASRVFQLRIYESATEAAGFRKVEMFNEGGEIDIFRRVGLDPVFFGQALIGTKLPNLTYMLGFDDMEAKEAGWKAFLADPAWVELKGQERYKKTVSNITNIMLKPAACSQI